MIEEKKATSKIRWGRVIAVVLILAVVIVSGVYFVGVHREKEVAKETVSQFLTAYQQANPKAGGYLEFDGKEEITFQGIPKLLAEKMTFTLDGVKKEDDVYLVEAVITVPDFKDAFQYTAKTASKDSSQEQILNSLSERLGSDNAKMREFELMIPVEKREEATRVILSSELSNSLSGGYNEYLANTIGGMYSDEKDN